MCSLQGTKTNCIINKTSTNKMHTRQNVYHDKTYAYQNIYMSQQLCKKICTTKCKCGKMYTNKKIYVLSCIQYILLRISFAVEYVLWHICSVVSRIQLLWYAILQCTICHNMFSFCSHFVTYSIGFVSFIFVDFEATFFISFCLASFLALRNEIFKRNAAKEACFSAE